MFANSGMSRIVSSWVCWAEFNSDAANESADRSLKDVVGDFERGLIIETLRRHHGDVLAVSESLGIPKKTLYDKMRRYALSGDEFR